jgi:hypothetical protein
LLTKLNAERSLVVMYQEKFPEISNPDFYSADLGSYYTQQSILFASLPLRIPAPSLN